jgi:hypothetical protein
MATESVRALTIRVPQSLFARLNEYCANQSKARGEVVSYSKGVSLLLEDLPAPAGVRNPRAVNGKKPAKRRAVRGQR